MTNKKVSVAIATYNGAKYLSEQLDSIFAQTLLPDEVVVVDDCSTDNSWKILQDYSSVYKIIKIYRNERNVGVTKTFERALSISSGDFIALADQDDYWLPNKLELLMANIDSHLLIYSDYLIVNENLDTLFDSSKKVLPYHDGSLSMFYLRCNVPGCATLYSRKLIDLALPFPDEIISHDHYLVVLAKFFGSIGYYNGSLLKYRQHANNVSGGIYKQNYAQMIDYFILHSKFCDTLMNSRFEFNQKEILCVKNYFDSIVNSTPPRFSTVYWVYKRLKFQQLVSFLAYSMLGRSVAKFIYKLLHRI